ncbi:O-antigen ligase family protein [Streptomyces sp. MST-110588]|uniref:O-antigen ligase family protein n=1 Tax=Streptomyces sp. MST-110588 TaxID=2833628 RepID=UPI001F5DED87|nr:O-antigen ligase family protein [Streptomyces sp. MST-110588]UNO43234.1 O-antigen ligase family protein [Streptomyces sp. MST-110588]
MSALPAAVAGEAPAVTAGASPAAAAAVRPPLAGLARGWRGARWRHARWWGPVAPALVTVLLLCAPPLNEGTAVAGGAGGTGGATVADAASALLVLWCAVRLTARRGAPACPLTPRAVLVLAAPVAAFAVATAVASDPAAGLPGFLRHLQVFVLVPGAVLLLTRDARDFRLLCGALIVLALVEGGIGVHQNLTGTGASYMGENIRAVGTFGARDVMGMSTVVAYGFLAAFSLGLGAPAGVPRRLRAAALGCAAVLLVPLALSYSRGAWIATAVAATVVLILSGARKAVPAVAALAAAAVVLVGGAGIGSQQISERFATITRVSAAPDRSVSDRYALWDTALGIWRDAPLTGVGIKGFPAHRDGHAPLGLSSGSDTAGAGQRFAREPLLSPHNMYLLLLSEQGLIGVTLVAGSWAALLILAVRRQRAARRVAGRSAAAGEGDCALAAVGLLVWLVVDFLYADIGGPSTVLTGIILGMAGWWALRPGGDREGCAR